MTIDTAGNSTGGNVTVMGTISGAHTLGLIAGTGIVHVTGAVGTSPLTPLTSLTITSAYTATFDSTLDTGSLAVTQSTTTTFTGKVTATGAVTAGSGGGDISFSAGLDAASANFSNTGSVTLGASSTIGGGLTHTAGDTSLKGTITTSTAGIDLGTSHTTKLAGGTTLDTTGHNIQLGLLDGGGFNLTLAAGIAAGTTTVSGAVSNLGSGTGGALQVASGVTGLVEFKDTVDAKSGLVALGSDSTIQFDGGVTLSGGDTATNLAGDVTLAGIQFSSNQNITFGTASGSNTLTLSTDAVTITTVASSGGTLTVNSAVGGAENLMLAVDGAAQFNADVGASGSPIGSGTGDALTITSTGATTFAGKVFAASGINQSSSAGLVTFDKDVTVSGANTDSFFQDNVALAGHLTFTAAGAVTFGTSGTNTVALSGGAVKVDTSVTHTNVTFNAKVNGGEALTITAGTGTVSFDGLVGDTAPLTSLSVTAATIDLNGGAVTTTGGQTYTGAVVLGADGDLKSNSSGSIQFSSTVDSDATSGPWSLTVNTGGTIGFGGAVGTANSKHLTNLLAEGGGTTQINGDVTTTGGQTYSDGVLLEKAVVLTTDTLSMAAVNLATFTLTVANSGAGTIAGLISGGTSGTNALVLGATDTAGNLTLSHSNNTYSGKTEIQAGTLIVTANGTLGAVGTGNETIVDASATLQLAVINYTALEHVLMEGGTMYASTNSKFAGPITLEAASNFFSSAAGKTLILNGDIDETMSTVAMALINSPLSTVSSTTGTVVLNGTDTYTGGTDVVNGLLLVNGFVDGDVTVGSATSMATLGGTGTIGNIVTVASEGTLAPGELATPGILSVGGDVNFTTGATYQAELDGTSPGTGYNQLILNGTAYPNQTHSVRERDAALRHWHRPHDY